MKGLKMLKITRNIYLKSRIKEPLYYLLAVIGGYRNRRKTKFLLHCGYRVGSHLLMTALNSHPEISLSSPKELFRSSHRVYSPRMLINGHAAKSLISVFGTKITLRDFEYRQKVNPEPIIRSLADDGWKFLHLSRRNVFLRGLSAYIASVRQTYRDTEADALQDFSISIVPSIMKLNMAQYINTVKKEKELLRHFPHLSIIYEDHLLDTTQRQLTCDKVFEFLGLASTPIRTPIVKTVPRDWRTVVKNHEEVAEAVLASPTFAQYLIDADKQLANINKTYV
jgi:hypothetical protein